MSLDDSIGGYGMQSVSKCRNCGTVLVDGREDSGATEYDPMTLGGDYGCDESPETTDDGVGDHDPIVPTTDGSVLDAWERRTETFTILVR
jgi:hypothetical protein